MKTQSKTTVDIIQELIAIHTTRKDVVEKVLSKEGSEANQAVVKPATVQSDHFISELLTELSEFGDAVQGSPDRENEYQRIWKNSLGDFDSMKAGDAVDLFNRMEEALKSIYRQIVETGNELPASLLGIVSSQYNQIHK